MHQPLPGPSDRDVTEARERVEDAERALRAIDHVQRLATVGSMAAGVAHEINNLLTPALAYAQLARSGRGDDPAFLSKAVDRAVDGIEAATALLASVLDLSRPGESDESTDLRPPIDRAIECLARRPQRDGVSIEVELDEERRVAIGRLTLQQVLLNLLLNAMKAIRENGGGRIRVSTTEADNGRIRLLVEDDGPGVPASIRERLFEPFVTTGGHGLGLSICREAIASVDGTIECLSTGGPADLGGACFVIELPVAGASAARRDGATPLEARPARRAG